MTTSPSPSGPEAPSPHTAYGAHYGAVTFAGMLMLLVGTLHLLVGLVALVDEDFYTARSPEPFAFDLAVWAWVHVVFGLTGALAGAGLLGGLHVARAAAVVVVYLSGLVNASWLPHYPYWSAIVIALDVFVLWALLAHGREPNT